MVCFFSLLPVLLVDILLLDMKKLKSLTIFFPFFNDAGTVSQAIDDAYYYGKNVSKNLEVIVIHGGRSTDNTFAEILKQKKKHSDLIIIDKTSSEERYAVIKYGFLKATKEWVFYTDGDLQYDLKEIKKLIKKQQETNADIVNGYRTQRADKIVRVLGGNLYRKFTRFLYKLPLRDLECDFRLIRTSALKRINLTAYDASIIFELIKKLQLSGARFAQEQVSHHQRSYGQSTYSTWSLLKEKLLGDIKVWFCLKKSV